MSTAKDILNLIQGSVDNFNGAIPGIQKKLYSELVKELQKLETREGKILTNINNLKLIGSIRNKLEKIILSKEYVKEVAKFVQAFELVTDLQQQYFFQFNEKYKPAKILEVVKKVAIDSTLNSLTEAGINANVLDPVQELLRTNITTGGNFDELLEGLRKNIITQDKDLGTLERYTKQITTDSLNQYSANYHDIVSEDLGFEWSRYVGSNITTTREFCEWLTKKDYVHKSELAEIIKGHIDGHNCKIYPKTGLPYGMVPATNVTNFPTYRGGYNCGHQFFAVPDVVVPAELLAVFQTNQPK